MHTHQVRGIAQIYIKGQPLFETQRSEAVLIRLLEPIAVPPPAIPMPAPKFGGHR
jgi:hypothetical protein